MRHAPRSRQHHGAAGNWYNDNMAMKKLRIYLDTSVINFLFADDAPEKRDITREFFARHLRNFDAVISEIVLFELRKTRDSGKRAALIHAVEHHAIALLEIAQAKRAEIERLADAYQHHGVFPAAKREDALHVAVCTIFAVDALVSWNYRHLANIRKQLLVNAINEQHGYNKELHLITPFEMMDENES